MTRLTKSDVAVMLGLEPARIIEFLRRRGYKITWDWHDTWQAEHARVRTVAKVARLDILRDLYDVLEQAIKEGKSALWYRKQLEEALQTKGWWGKITEVNPNTGEEEEIQAGSTWRLNTIYNTSASTLYSAGRWETQIQDDARPYWLYVAIRDNHTRPRHLLLHGRCFPKTDPFWQDFYPPNGWNCRCTVIALTADEVRARGIVVSGSEGALGRALRQVSKTAEARQVATYQAAGKTISPDAGFSYNPGSAFRPDLTKYRGDLAALARREL